MHQSSDERFGFTPITKVQLWLILLPSIRGITKLVLRSNYALAPTARVRSLHGATASKTRLHEDHAAIERVMDL